MFVYTHDKGAGGVGVAVDGRPGGDWVADFRLMASQLQRNKKAASRKVQQVKTYV